MKAPETILVVKLRAIGDAVIATPALRTLHEAYPAARILVLTTPAAAPIFQTLPYVDEVMEYSKSLPARAWTWPAALVRVRRAHPDLAVNLHASYHSAWLTARCGARTVVVHNHSGENFFSTVPILAAKEPKSAIERDLDAVRALGLTPASAAPEVRLAPADEAFADEWFRRHGVPPGASVVAMNPGASRATKRWPLERFVAVGRALAAEGAGRLLWIGGPGDAALLAAARTATGGEALAASGQSILQSAALLKRCRVLLGNDVGTHHLAAALGVPTVTIFGPELPREWHPYAPPRHVALSKPVHCVNCGLHQCDRLECQYVIRVEDAVRAVERALALPFAR